MQTRLPLSAHDRISCKVIYDKDIEKWIYFKDKILYARSDNKYNYAVFPESESGEVVPFMSDSIIPMTRFVNNGLVLYVITEEHHPYTYKLLLELSKK